MGTPGTKKVCNAANKAAKLIRYGEKREKKKERKNERKSVLTIVSTYAWTNYRKQYMII